MSRPDRTVLLAILAALGSCDDFSRPRNVEKGVPMLDGLGDASAGERAARDRASRDGATPCSPIAGVTYDTMAPGNPYSGDASKQGDMNLLLRSWRAASETRSLVDIAGPTDFKPGPQLFSLFLDDRVPTFVTVYQLQGWDWSCNCPGAYLTDPKVTLAGMAVTAGEVIRAPFSGYDIGGGHTALLLHAGRSTVTLKYTGDDDVVKGYTVHLDGICVEPSLQALYDQCNAGGRKQLPAIKSRQPLGRALAGEVRAAIRDTGSLMDPRSRKDWWQGK